MYDTLLQKDTLVFGCGNPLFGDDGFGPEVIAHLEASHSIPEHCACLDAGTSIRDILFDILLSREKPRRIIIIDAVDVEGRTPGELFEMDVENIPANKTSDFSLHQFPTTNMLKELSDATPIDVRVFVVQAGPIPDAVNPGLSPAVQDAIPILCRNIVALMDSPIGTALQKAPIHCQP